MEPIKRLKDLTFEEITTIFTNSDTYQNLIDLEYAHAGISLLPDNPGPKPDNADSKPDTMLYKVGNWGFKTVTDAQDVIEFMISKGIYIVESINNVHVIKQLNNDSYYWPEIKSIPAFTPEAFALIKDSVSTSAKQLSDWKERDAEYLTIYKERQAILTEFETKKQYVNEVLTGIARIKNNLKRYLTLAQGSYPIAVTFLHDAEKHGTIAVNAATDAIYFVCSNGKKHLVTTREQYQKDSMEDLLGVNK